MAVSQNVQNAMRGPRRTVEAFGDERDADDRAGLLKEEGSRNVRKSRFVDFTRSDGTKVYGWTVRCDV